MGSLAGSLRNLAKRAVSGPAEWAIRGYHRGRARILTYHRFPASDLANFERQCQHLRRHYHPISLDDLVAAVNSGDPLPPHSIAITIDDGYRDVYENGAPILERYKIPATLYAVSGFLDGRTWMWWDRIIYAFTHTRRTTVELDLPELGPFTASWNNPASAPANPHASPPASPTRKGGGTKPDQIADRVAAHLGRLDNSNCDAWVAHIADRLEVEIPAQPPDEYAAMTWQQARELPSRGITIGSHTDLHYIIGTIADPTIKRREIFESRRILEAKIERPVHHFCFPNGGVGDFSQFDLSLVRQAGYRSSVTTLPGMIGPATDAFQLPRINSDAAMPFDFFRLKIAGKFSFNPDVRIPTKPAM